MHVCLSLLCVGPALLVPVLLSAAHGWKVLTNDATENVPEYQGGRPRQADAAESSNNSTINRAKHGGRAEAPNTETYGTSNPSCQELRSTRYIIDGPCRSSKPLKELICSGQCLPPHLMPNSILRGKWWRQQASDYRCVPAHSRTQRFHLLCPNEEVRTYKMRVVTSCKCKRYTRHHNQSEFKEMDKTPTKRRRSKASQAVRARSRGHRPESQNAY
uniref:Sclerostin n=1 Tax=Erpetoichthys calabaricus TaxID=27687 RepID=A0A8C4TC80_ERPCA